MKCTKLYNVHAQLLFCSLNLLLGGVLVAVIVVMCLSSLMFCSTSLVFYVNSVALILGGVIVLGCVACLNPTTLK